VKSQVNYPETNKEVPKWFGLKMCLEYKQVPSVWLPPHIFDLKILGNRGWSSCVPDCASDDDNHNHKFQERLEEELKGKDCQRTEQVSSVMFSCVDST